MSKFTLTELIIMKNRLSEKLYELNGLFYQTKSMNVDILVARIKMLLAQVEKDIDYKMYDQYPWKDKNIAAAVLYTQAYKEEEEEDANV